MFSATVRNIPFLIGVLLILAACSQMRSTPSPFSSRAWFQVGAGLTAYTSVTQVAFDPHNSDRAVAAAYDRPGLYMSQDGGDAWLPVNDAPVALHRIQFDGVRPGVLWAASADGLFQGTWTDGRWLWRAAAGWPSPWAAFALHQNEDGVLYAGGEGPPDEPPTLWRSQDGEHWHPLAPLPLPAGAALLAVTWVDGRLLVGTDGRGLFASEDGQLWTQAAEIGDTHVAGFWKQPGRTDLVIARTRRGLFRSQDRGRTWQMVDLAAPARPDVIASTPGGLLWVGMGNGVLLRSQDSGLSWRVWSHMPRDGLFFSLASAPDGRIFAGTQYGLFRSADGGRTWTRIETVGRIQGNGLLLAGDGTLYLGSVDGVHRWVEETQQWVRHGQPLPQAVRALAAASSTPPVLFAGTDRGLYRLRSTDATWELIAWPERGVVGIVADPDDPNRLYIRLAFERVYSTDEALAPLPTWTARWEGMSETSEILSLAVDPGASHRLFAGGARDFFISEDRGNVWQPAGPALRGQSIFTLVVDPTRPQRLYAGATTGLHRSEDDGRTWTTTGLSNLTVTALVWNPERPQVRYAGTKDRGVWRTVDGGRTWRHVGPLLGPESQALGAASSTSLEMDPALVAPPVMVRSLAFSADGQWLFAATDQGVWRMRAR